MLDVVYIYLMWLTERTVAWRLNSRLSGYLPRYLGKAVLSVAQQVGIGG